MNYRQMMPSATLKMVIPQDPDSVAHRSQKQALLTESSKGGPPGPLL